MMADVLFTNNTYMWLFIADNYHFLLDFRTFQTKTVTGKIIATTSSYR